MAPEGAHAKGTFSTQRMDMWWLEPALIFLLLSGFVVYATFRILESTYTPAHRFFDVDNGHYHYLSPFGTPDLTMLIPAGLANIPVLGLFLTNPAFLILPFPAGFRFTCYYYRKAYYRSFAARPAACAVEAVKGKKYRGEKGLMVVQNLHRYFLYAAILITAFLAYDAVRSIVTPNGLYFGLGSALMLVNVGLLCAYTFGCHSLRHLVGGKLDCFSCDAIGQTRYKWWQFASRLNSRHMLFAMTSLVSVALTDIYIRWVGQQLAADPSFSLLWGMVPA